MGRVILSEGLARSLFGDRDPIGALVELPDGKGLSAEVVGVAVDTRLDLTGPIAPTLYEPLGQGGFEFYKPLGGRTLSTSGCGADEGVPARSRGPSDGVAPRRCLAAS